MAKERATIMWALASSLALVLLQLQSVQGQVPTWEPTSSMWPTSTPMPTSTAYPTSTWMPTSTPLPTVTTFPSTTPPVNPPASAPTPGIQEIQTTTPTALPTRTPTAAPVATVPVPIPTPPPTKAPTASPTVAVAAPTVPPTGAPVVAPTGSPVVTPTVAPTNAPTAGPTAAPVVTATDPPTSTPTTLSPTTSPTISPTSAPTEVPTMTAETIDTVVEGIKLSLVNAGQLGTAQLEEWAGVTSSWFNTYFENNGEQSGVRNMRSVVSVVSQQELVDSSTGAPVNLITYDHRLIYEALPNAPDAQLLAFVPFGVETAIAEYANLLKTRYPSAFGELQTPIELPELASPTDGPSDAPSLAPVTAVPTEVDMTAVPTSIPTEATDTGMSVDTALRGISIQFVNAGVLEDDEIETFQTTMASWFNNYYLQDSGDNNSSSNSTSSPQSRRLQDSTIADRTAVRDMSSTITVTNQEVETMDGARTNTVTYEQFLTYVALEGAADPEEYATLPFLDDASNVALGLELREFQNFDDVRLPLQVPNVPDQSQIRDSGDDDGLGTGAIIGIAVGGGVALLGLGAFGYSQMKGGGEYKETDQGLPPSHFNVSADEDISTMDEPITSKVGDQPSLTGGYGDQSVATVDYDYSKAYGGGDTSVVSSAGGTMGDATRQTGEMTASGGTALTALGAEANYGESLGTKDEVLEIYAPAGKLGVVIDTPDDGAPVVHAVKDSSVIADQIQVGDKLIAVDDENVRSMTAIKVSKLISKKSANPSRKLTIIRTSMFGDPEG